MQFARQGMQVGGYLNSPLSQSLYPFHDFIRRIRSIFLELCEIDGQQSKSLTNVVMQFSRNPLAFLLLRLNQLSGHARHNLFGSLEISYICDHADHPQQFPFAVEEALPAAP